MVVYVSPNLFHDSFRFDKKKKKKVFRTKILNPTMCLYGGVKPNYAVNGKIEDVAHIRKVRFIR